MNVVLSARMVIMQMYFILDCFNHNQLRVGIRMSSGLGWFVFIKQKNQIIEQNYNVNIMIRNETTFRHNACTQKQRMGTCLHFLISYWKKQLPFSFCMKFSKFAITPLNFCVTRRKLSH